MSASTCPLRLACVSTPAGAGLPALQQLQLRALCAAAVGRLCTPQGQLSVDTFDQQADAVVNQLCDAISRCNLGSMMDVALLLRDVRLGDLVAAHCKVHAITVSLLRPAIDCSMDPISFAACCESAVVCQRPP
jgi:hypothetical protein